MTPSKINSATTFLQSDFSIHEKFHIGRHKKPKITVKATMIIVGVLLGINHIAIPVAKPKEVRNLSIGFNMPAFY